MSESREKTRVRRQAILAATANGEVSTLALAQRFGVTVSTIRRDLQQLALHGDVARTYGGITRTRRVSESDVHRKALQHRREKDAIAAAAARYVTDDSVVMLDAGTTVGQLAAALRDREHLTVVTAGMNALLELHDSTCVELIVVGGRLRPVNQGMVGAVAERFLDAITPDIAFVGAEGVDPAKGICCPSIEQASFKAKIMERAREVYVLADSSKLCREAFNYWAPLPDKARLITDAADEEFVRAFTARSGRRLEIAPLDASSSGGSVAKVV